MNDDLYVRIRDRWEGTHIVGGERVVIPTVIQGTLDDLMLRLAVEEAAAFYQHRPLF